ERVLAGVTRIVVDGESDDDLRAAADALDGLDVVTASPGAWLRHHPRSRGEFVLVVLGSNTHLNHLQLAALDGTRARVGETISSPAPGDAFRDPRMVDSAADEAAEVLRAAYARGERCRGIVASGGHMASRLVDRLGARSLAAAGEVAPLCPRGTLSGGAWS